MAYQWSKEIFPSEEGITCGVYPEGGSYRMVSDCYGGTQILRTIKQLSLDGFEGFFDQAEEGFADDAALPVVEPGADLLRWSDDSAPPLLTAAPHE